MQMGRRCSACDAHYLASVQLARGLLEQRSVWGRVLADALSDGRNKWTNAVCGRLREMSLLSHVLEDPATLLGERKSIAIEFSQWCHHRHLVFVNGTSADDFRVDRPFGIMPVIADYPTFRTKNVMLLVLSVWRWSLAEGGDHPDYCVTCDCLHTSHHLLFRCEKTADLRGNFQLATGEPFTMRSLYNKGNGEEILNICDAICERLGRDF
jgi:hypothetical protein